MIRTSPEMNPGQLARNRIPGTCCAWTACSLPRRLTLTLPSDFPPPGPLYGPPSKHQVGWGVAASNDTQLDRLVELTTNSLGQVAAGYE